MADISRRRFIKSIGLCTILTATGNIHEGFSLVPPYFSTAPENDCRSSEPDSHIISDNTPKSLFIGVGKHGHSIGQSLRSRIRTPDNVTKQSISIQQFDPKNQLINGLIASADFVFLAGSITDRDFWLARELILGHSVYLLYTVAIDNGNPRDSRNSFKTKKNEVFVFTPGVNYRHSAFLSIQSLFAVSMIPGIICLDLTDMKTVVGGRSGYMVHTASSYRNSRDEFKKAVCCCKADIRAASSLLLHIMYDEIVDYTFDDLEFLSETVYECSSPDVDMVWGGTDSVVPGADFRASLFIPFQP